MKISKADHMRTAVVAKEFSKTEGVKKGTLTLDALFVRKM